MPLFFLPFQLMLLVFLLFAFSRVVLRFREGSVGPGPFLFWSGIWTLATVSVIRPDFSTYVANIFGIGRGVDAITYASLITLFYLMYRTNVQIENLKHELTKLARIIALSSINSNIYTKEKHTKRKKQIKETD